MAASWFGSKRRGFDGYFDVVRDYNTPQDPSMAALAAQRSKRGQDPLTGVGMDYREFAGLPTAGAMKIWGPDAVEQNEVQLRGGASKVADERMERLARALGSGMPGQPGANGAQVGLSGFLNGLGARRVATGMPSLTGGSDMLSTTSFSGTTPGPYTTSSVKQRPLDETPGLGMIW